MRRVFLILSAAAFGGSVLLLGIGCTPMNTYPTLGSTKQLVDRAVEEGAEAIQTQTEELTKQHAVLGEAVGVPPEVQAEIDRRVADLAADMARDIVAFRDDTQRIVDDGVDNANERLTSMAGVLRGEFGGLFGGLKSDTEEDIGGLESLLEKIPVAEMTELVRVAQANPGKFQTALIEAGVPPSEPEGLEAWMSEILLALGIGGVGVVGEVNRRRVNKVDEKVENDRTMRPPPVQPVVLATSAGGASSTAG